MIVHDFAEIAKALKEREAEKPPIVTDPNPPDYVELPTVETVYGMYGYSTEQMQQLSNYHRALQEQEQTHRAAINAPFIYPHGYLEAFEAYARAKKSFC